MKQLYKLLLATVFCILQVIILQAHCPDCTIDYNCNTIQPTGGFCADLLPPATAGMAYDFNNTYYYPSTIIDNNTGEQLQIDSIEFINFNGMPFAMAAQCLLDSDCKIYPAQGDNYMCFTWCGITNSPPGIYKLNVEIQFWATVIASGEQLTYVQNKEQLCLEVLENTGNGAGIALDGGPTCFSNYVADFSATIDGSPNMTKYLWNFANGNTSTLQTPPQQSYIAPFFYRVFLETSICGYELQTFCAESVNSDWCSDINAVNEVPDGNGDCSNAPDLYFIIEDSNNNVIYTSPTQPNRSMYCWPFLGLQLPDPPYTFYVYDDDTNEAADLLGTYALSPNGTGSYNLNDPSGSTASTIFGEYNMQIHYDTLLVPTYATNIVLGANITDASAPGLSDGSIDLIVSNGAEPYEYEWSNNVSTEDLNNLSAGVYTVVVNDEDGCSATYSYTVYEQPIPPISLALDDLRFNGNYIADGNVSLDWSLFFEENVSTFSLQHSTDGIHFESIDNQFSLGKSNYNYIHAKAQEGVNYYKLIVYDQFLKELDIKIIAIDVPYAEVFNLYPNPASNYILLDFGNSSDEYAYEIKDIQRKLLITGTSNSNTTSIDISKLHEGFYTIFIKNKKSNAENTMRFVKLFP